MVQSDRNYARFYALLRQMPGCDKETLVLQYTGGRTTSLKETTDEELRTMLLGMEHVTGEDERRRLFLLALKKQRSVCLKLMQQMGVDTTDWNRVDMFCEHPRMCGKRFARLSGEELEALERKLRAMKRKGWTAKAKEAPTHGGHTTTTIILPMNPGGSVC